MFKTTYDKEKQIFSIHINNKKEIDLKFSNLIPKNSIINIFDDITSIIINDDFILTIFDKKSSTEFVFQKSISNNADVNVELLNTENIKSIDKNTYSITTKNNNLYFVAQDTQFNISTENNIILSGIPSEMRLIVSTTDNKITPNSFKSININSEIIKMMELTEPYIYKVQIGQQIPEFSIKLYDDSNHDNLRPLFNGTPVLSTIAAVEPDVDKMGDSHFYTYGFGPATRTSYIQVSCNVNVETPDLFTLYMANVNPQLRIYKISTGDLLVAKELINKSYTNNKYIYKTTFDVLEDWGSNELLLIDVFLKIRIYSFLPITFSVGQSGTNEQPLYNIFSE
jgi:hypothetical protein